jgi:hypothetical protein
MLYEPMLFLVRSGKRAVRPDWDGRKVVRSIGKQVVIEQIGMNTGKPAVYKFKATKEEREADDWLVY